MDQPNKPLHVTHIASGDLWAGAEVQLFTLCKPLHRMANVNVSVILLNHGTLEEKLKKQDIPVTILDETRLNGFQIIKCIHRTLKQNKPDIVHTHRLKENILGSLAAKATGIPSLRTIHGAPEHALDWRRPHKALFYILDWITGFFIQEGIIVVSGELKTTLTNIYPAKKLKVIENGVDLETLTPYCRSPEERIIPTGPYKIGLVARLVPVKRVDLFIQTATYLRKHHPEIQAHFHIYGGGPLRSELEDLTRKHKIEDIVHFEGHCDDIHQQIASLDVLLITSDHEGLPMTLLEAMAIGIPVVAHATGGISKACNFGEYCWLSDDNSAHMISLKLNDCLRNNVSLINKTISAQHQIKKNYSAFNQTNLYIATYLEIVKRRKFYP